MRNTRLYLALSAILRKDESAAIKAEAYLRGGSTASQLIISSLAAAGTEASQRVLRTVWEDERFSYEQRKAATFALIRTKNPSVASAEFLEARLNDERRHDFAEMGLGIFVRLFGESGQTDLQKRFADALIRHLTTAQTSIAREGALLGLSNAGYDPALPTAQKYLNDSDVKVRSAAVQSLRLMKTQKVDKLIVHALEHDAEPEVRRNALQALDNRTYHGEIGRAVGDCLGKDQDPKVRLTALSLLASWARTNPELVEPIRKAASDDANFMVKKEAGVVAARLSALAHATPSTGTNR